MQEHNQVPQFCVVVPLMEVGLFVESNFRPSAVRVFFPVRSLEDVSVEESSFVRSLGLSMDSGLHDLVNAVTFRLCRVGYKPSGAPGKEMLYVLEDKTTL